MGEPLLELRAVTRDYDVKGGRVRAVAGVDLAVLPGDVVSLVGESGSGKTTTGRLAAGLIAPSSGQVLYRGRDIRSMDRREWRAYRLGVQLVHQDPYSSLNPSHRVGDMLSRPLRRHKKAASRGEAEVQVRRLLADVDLAADVMNRYPHELSGGQRQRVSIARALTVDPTCIVADEAVSMVDVSLRISILRTLSRLREERGLAVLFISHDLALARHFAREGRVAVMYLGQIVEVAAANHIVSHPSHPYTAALLEAVPRDPRTIAEDAEDARGETSADAHALVGDDEVPSLLDRPAGCAFHPRCPRAAGVCRVSEPALVRHDDGAQCACHFPLDAAPVAAANTPEPSGRPRRRP